MRLNKHSHKKSFRTDYIRLVKLLLSEINCFSFDDIATHRIESQPEISQQYLH